MKNNNMSLNHELILPMMWLAGCKCHSNICDDVFIIFICCGVLFAQAIPHTLWYYILSIILILLISEKIFILLLILILCSVAALYLMAVSVLAGFWGQYFIRKLVAILKRASLIVFLLSGVIFASALTMGNYGKSLSQEYTFHFRTFIDLRVITCKV